MNKQKYRRFSEYFDVVFHPVLIHLERNEFLRPNKDESYFWNISNVYFWRYKYDFVFPAMDHCKSTMVSWLRDFGSTYTLSSVKEKIISIFYIIVCKVKYSSDLTSLKKSGKSENVAKIRSCTASTQHKTAHFTFNSSLLIYMWKCSYLLK